MKEGGDPQVWAMGNPHLSQLPIMTSRASAMALERAGLPDSDSMMAFMVSSMLFLDIMGNHLRTFPGPLLPLAGVGPFCPR
jgi:hypothetical protein